MSTPAITNERLKAQIAAVCPILGVSVGTTGNAATVRIDFAPSATGSQQTAAQSVVTGFDWSQAAQDSFDLAQSRTQTSGFTTTPIQSVPLAALVRAVVLIVLDEFNLHALKINAILDASDAATSLADFKARVAAIPDYPARTKSQLLAAITTKIGAGDTDS